VEIDPAYGWTRATVAFNPTTSRMASNAASMQFGPFSSQVVIRGVRLWDAPISGNMLWQGQLESARTISVGKLLRGTDLGLIL